MVHVAWLAEALARHGHTVDIWLSECKVTEIDEDRLYAAGVRIHQPAETDFFALPHVMGDTPYDIILGVEKGGLIWAERAARLYGAELWYYSLEIYLEDHPDREQVAAMNRRLGEIGALSRVAVTIIQDDDRWNALAGANRHVLPGLTQAYPQSGGRICHLPVSISGEKVTAKSTWLHQRLDIPEDKKIILYFGHMQSGRFVDELLASANELPDPYVLVLHGPSINLDIDAIKALLPPGKAYYSAPDVAEQDLYKLISSAHVGAALYSQIDINRRLTARSSEKIARYAQCGVPFLAINNANYRRLKDEYDICELIDSPADLVAAVQRIDQRHDVMRAACFDAFEALYRFESNVGFIPEILDAAEARRDNVKSALWATPRADVPGVSVVIPTRNRADLLVKLLYSFVTQTLPQDAFEIIVADNGSTDDTASVCEMMGQQLPNLRVIRDDRPGLHVGRHAGLAAARGDIIVYCDDDIIASPRWLEALSEPFSDPTVALVGGPALPLYESTPPDWLAQFQIPVPGGMSIPFLSLIDMGNQTQEIEARHIYGCNFAVRRLDILAAGGFNPDGMPADLLRFRGNGETGATPRIVPPGFKAVYAPAAKVQHLASADRLTVDYVWQRAYRQGISQCFGQLRRAGPLSVPALPPPGTTDQMAAWKLGVRQGYLYLFSEAQSDPRILQWIRRPSYFDAPDCRESV